MKKHLSALLCLTAISLLSGLAHGKVSELPPGLWKMTVQLVENGETKTSGNEEALTLCYSKKYFQDGATTITTPNCKRTVKEDGPTKYLVAITCDDGSTGESEIEIINQRHFKTRVEMKDKKGETGNANSDMTFVSADCGKQRPYDGQDVFNNL